ncbi:MAG TPA: NAD(P)H-binding protein [Microbacteriaceae bacterium]
MKIGIIGATGKAGRALYAEATKRGHEVTGIVRDPDRAGSILGTDATVLVKDAFDLTADDLTAFDVVIDAFSTPPARAYLHVDLAARLVSLLRETQTPRLVFIVGAGSLTTGEDHRLLVEDLRRLAEAGTFIATPENQLKELQFLRGVDDVNWVAVSPSRTFVPGAATGFVTGKDDLLFAPDGSSQVTTGTMAVAILNEIENPKHVRERFTVRDE